MGMQESCKRAGVAAADLVVLNVEGLQDGFHSWDPEVAARHVRVFLRDRAVGLVLTFDAYGVSGHPNHVSTSQGVCRVRDALASQQELKKVDATLEVLMLESTPLWQKYVGGLSLLGAEVPAVGPKDAALATWREPFACLRALAAHWSQLKWYRVLFTLFSRYAYVNTFVRYAASEVPAGGSCDARAGEPGGEGPRQRR